MDIILLGHIGFMVVSLAIAVATTLIKLPKINKFAGYRTPFSMKNEATWEEANSYSTKVQFWLSTTFCVLTISSYLLVGGLTSFYLSSFLLAAISISVIPITEYHLHKKFDSNGNRLN